MSTIGFGAGDILLPRVLGSKTFLLGYDANLKKVSE
jgi:hypothetical protein